LKKIISEIILGYCRKAILCSLQKSSSGQKARPSKVLSEAKYLTKDLIHKKLLSGIACDATLPPEEQFWLQRCSSGFIRI
jgi:hypothetical protein